MNRRCIQYLRTVCPRYFRLNFCDPIVSSLLIRVNISLQGFKGAEVKKKGTMYSDSDASPNYDHDYGYDDYSGCTYDSDYAQCDELNTQLGLLTKRKDEAESHKHEKRRQDIQVARKHLQEGTRRGNMGGDTAFGALYDQELCSDLILSVGDRTFFAHRLILCVWSDVFKTMLSDPTWQPHNELCDESGDNAARQIFRQTLVEEDPDVLVFEDFLKFLYTATVALTTDNVLSLVRLADKYIIPELHGLCNEFINDSSSDVETMLSLLPKAREFNMPDIVKLCQQSLLVNFNLLSGQEMLDIDAATMLVVLDSGHDLVVESEYALFEKIEPWLMHCEDDDIFVKIIKCFRFPFMNAQQLLKVTATAVFSRASEKLPHLPLEVWQIQTLFRESAHGDLPHECPGPRLYLRPPNSYSSEEESNESHWTNDSNHMITIGLEELLYVSPWIKRVAGKKRKFSQGPEQTLLVLVTKVSHDKIKIKVSLELTSRTQSYHTAIGIGLPNQVPQYFKASAGNRLSGDTGFSTLLRGTTILNCNAKLTRPIEQDAELQINVALIIEKQKKDDSKSATKIQRKQKHGDNTKQRKRKHDDNTKQRKRKHGDSRKRRLVGNE